MRHVSTWPWGESSSQSTLATLHESPQKKGGADELHGQLHLAAWDHYGVGSGHEGAINHVSQVLKIYALGFGADHHDDLIWRRNIARDKWVGRIHSGYPLKIDVRVRKLRIDEVQMIRFVSPK